MLKHTKKIQSIYQDIQTKIYYMIPEKWDKLYLYASILDQENLEGNTGELYFYYLPKGFLRKKMVNVYEIPSKFNLDESKYLSLVKILYDKVKELREEFKKSEPKGIWSNLTILIENSKFKVEYDYTDLERDYLTSYQRHVIWRHEYLGIGIEQLNKEEKLILQSYISGLKSIARKEKFEMGTYINDVENIIGYTTNEVDLKKENNFKEEHQEENKIVNEILSKKQMN